MNDDAVQFLADGMLGKLAKWLRLLGYDTAYDNAATDHELARRARAEDRVLLTRDRELTRRRGLRVLLIESERLENQVQEVWYAFGPPPHPALSRCSVCNTALQPVHADEVTDRLPPYVLRTQTEFHRCPGCGRVYWPGTHQDHIRQRVEQLVAVGKSRPPAE
ncbi:MAG TPA: hypothetical protein ENN99_02515 [Chloroflexi bacterium]|nr:hypothetical protein [Chloroflexota bacterium]